MGTLLQTRSFTIEESEESEEQAAMEDVGDTKRSGTDVDEEREQDSGDSREQLDDDEEYDGVVVLTPLADMLNARYGQNNVCNFFSSFNLPLNARFHRSSSSANRTSK